MNDMRALVNDRTYLTTFIIGNHYVSVAHTNKVYEEILDALEEFLGELKKPFVVVSMTNLYYEAAVDMNERELVDIFIEG
jgi:hypothetical protein